MDRRNGKIILMRNVTRHNVSFLVHDDSNDEIRNFWNIDSWEARNYSVVANFSKRCPTFVNAGGWIGPFTLFAAKLYSSVYSLEPDPLAFSELVRNVQLNNFQNVTLSNKAFFDDSKTSITMGSDFSPLGRSGTSIFQLDKAVEVPCVTLSQFFSENRIPNGSFLMLDVEGAEYVLFDDISFFERFQPVILLEFHGSFLSQENFAHIISSLSRLNNIYSVDVNSFSRNNISHHLIQLR